MSRTRRAGTQDSVRRALSRVQVAHARREGIDAHDAGVNRLANPYRGRDLEVLVLAWDSAWCLSARAERISDRGPSVARGPGTFERTL